ncbi:MAG: serine/threonine protein kinase [Verrucomicrobia bacterium]|nr:serine/threonine protein kinase [Verrucomicrobiota bacterium]MBV8483167.1 serine/threonine protein kinase [Verrucomicrobiota bacterium]
MLSQTSAGSVGNDVSAPATQPSVPGSATIAGYTILSPIPHPGAQADVYVARDHDNQRYAVKLYRALTTPSAAAARALAQLSSRRLLVPLFRGEWQGRAVEVTQLFPLGNLADFIKRNGPLDKEQALRLVRQVTEGLEQLHGAGVQHRDLKPSNILVQSEQPLELALADFGSAGVTDSTVLTQPHGTLFYSAPETLTGMYSRASDYWSLGIILIEALSGSSIAATLRNDALLPYRIVQGKVPIPSSIPKGWQPLLRGLLQRDHYRRWQAAEVHSWLDREGRKVGVATERKARPFLIASLALALALIIGAGLCLGPGMPARIDLLAIAVTTTTALAWILSGIFLLIGVTHTISGAPHGPISVLAGIFLAVGAYFLPRLWG